MSKKYHAFISYRHLDNTESGRQWATWLHQAIETYQVPDELVGKLNDSGEVIPERIFPVFRDEEALPADADLSNVITRALDDSQFLIVLCSPRATESSFVADEIRYFKKLGRSNRIIAAIVDGEPNTSLDESKLSYGFSAQDECFPNPLQFIFDENGEQTEQRTEPVAADFRVTINNKKAQGWTTPKALQHYLASETNLSKEKIKSLAREYDKQLHRMLLKVIAGIIGVSLDDLTQRDRVYQLALEKQRAARLRRWLASVVVLATVSIFAGLYAIQKRSEAQQAKQVAVANQARSTMKSMIENWQIDQNPQSLSVIGEVIDLDVSMRESYRSIFADLSESMLTIEQAVSKLSTEVFTWKGNTYVSLNGKIHPLYQEEASSFASAGDSLIVVMPNRGVLVWDKQTKSVIEFDDYRPMNTVTNIYQHENLDLVFVVGAYIGATPASSGCRSFSTYVTVSTASVDNSSAASVECFSGSGLEVRLPSGDLSDWNIITQTPEKLSFPALSNKSFATHVVAKQQKKQLRCPLIVHANCKTEQQQHLADAMITHLEDDGELIASGVYVEFRQQFHFLYSRSHEHTAREERLCIYNQVFRPCITWFSAINGGVNEGGSAFYFSEDANLVVIIGGGGRFGDEVIVFHYDKGANKYQRLKIDSLPFNESFVGAAVASNEQFVIAVENRLSLYQLQDEVVSRLVNIDIDVGLAVAALNHVGVLSITSNHSNAEFDGAGLLSFRDFQLASQQHERNFWSKLPEAEWHINLHDFKGNLVWRTSLPQPLKNHLAYALKLKSEMRDWGANIYYPNSIEVVHLKAEDKLIVKLMDKVIIIDALFGYLFGELVNPTDVSLNKPLKCTNGKRCVVFNDELLLLEPSPITSDIDQIIADRLGHINSEGIRDLIDEN